MTMLVRAFIGVPKEPSLDEAQVVSVDGKFYLEDKTNGLRFSPSKFKDGIVKLKDKTYLLNADGSLGQGFIEKNNKTYYVDGENGLAIGWKRLMGLSTTSHLMIIVCTRMECSPPVRCILVWKRRKIKDRKQTWWNKRQARLLGWS